MQTAKGFSLLEVNMALLILALGVSAAFSGYGAIADKLEYGRQRQQAQLVIAQLYEVLPVYTGQISWLVTQTAAPQTSQNPHCWQGEYCSSQQMLSAWWQQWQTTLSQQLTDGKLVLTCDSGFATGTSMQIQVLWHGPVNVRSSCENWHCVSMSWRL